MEYSPKLDQRGIALVLTFDHPQQVTQNFAREIMHGLICQGFESRILSMNSDMQSQAAAIDWARVRLCVALGPLPLTITVDGAPIYETLRCPFIVYVLDSLFYDLQRVPQTRAFVSAALNDPRLMIACADEDFVDILNAYADSQNAKINVCFTPFAAFINIPSAPAPERQQRALLVGNIGNELSAQSVCHELPQTLLANASGIADPIRLNHLAEAMLSADAPQNITKLFAQVLSLDPQWILDAPVLHLLAAADSHLKRIRRSLLAQALVKSPIPVDIFGTGWQFMTEANPEIRMLGNLSHVDLFEVSMAYAYGINIDPNWGRGFHDRVFTFLAAGMQVLSNTNAFTDQLPIEGIKKMRHFNVFRPESIQNALSSDSIDSDIPWSWNDLRTVEGHHWTNRCNTWMSCLG